MRSDVSEQVGRCLWALVNRIHVGACVCAAVSSDHLSLAGGVLISMTFPAKELLEYGSMSCSCMRDIDAQFRSSRCDVTDEDDKFNQWTLLVTESELQVGVRYLAAYLNKVFANTEEEILFVGILNGAFVFLGDLVKLLTFRYSTAFVQASSYCDMEQASQVKTSALGTPTGENRHIVIVDELFDNGATMHAIKGNMLANGADKDHILTLTLMQKDKQRPEEYGVPDVTAFPAIPDVWLVGYGLDHHGRCRGWPHLYGVMKQAGQAATSADAMLTWPAHDPGTKEYIAAEHALRRFRTAFGCVVDDLVSRTRSLVEETRKVKECNP